MAKKANSANNSAREGETGLFEGGDDRHYNGSGFEEISKIVVMLNGPPESG